MTTIAIIQARSGSSRLPKKVLQLVDERPMIQMVVDRVGRAREVDKVIVATTSDPSDDELADFVRQCGAEVVRGDTFDVLARYALVLSANPDADVVVRVTADCPFIDPEIIDDAVSLLKRGEFDFVANRLPPPSLRTFPVGLDVEVCTAKALRGAVANATAPHHREHVMPYLYENGADFKIHVMNLDEDLSQYRWTVDTAVDLEVVRTLAALCPEEPYSWREVLRVAREHPEIGEQNSSVAHKVVTDVDARWQRKH